MTAWVRRSIAAAAVAGIVALANVPVTTLQGVNQEVTAHRLPLYLKSFQFLARSAEYSQIAGEVTSGARTDEERVLRAFEWTRRRIRPTPDGWPIVDDHILNIIIRGHGVNDQQADVFTTLATYAGVSAFWMKVPPDRSRPGVILSFADVGGQWRVFDVANAVVFRTPVGALATLEDLSGHPEMIPESVRSLTVRGVGYPDILTHATTPPVPRPLRSELQMPARRVWHELLCASIRTCV